jgi:tRNA (guanine-N7-)-methyltransferase
LGSRPTAGRQTLDLLIGVRILSPQPKFFNYYLPVLVPSSRGPGRSPLKAKTRVRIPLGPPATITTTRCRGRLRKAHKEALERFLPLIEIPQDGLLSPQKVFNRKAPLFIEIGFGNGEFLYGLAKENLEADFIGIEVFLTGIAKLIRRMIDYGKRDVPAPSNLKIIAGDARFILSEMIPDETIDGFYILFPDPWPKKRHHKRRLINPDFARLLYKKLKTSGFSIIATDNEDYAGQIKESLEKAGFILTEIKATRPLRFDFSFATRILNTKYAQKAINSGREIFIFKALTI